MLNLHETASLAAKDLKRRLIDAEERERNRVARELHDDIGQQLVTLSMDIARLREMLPAQSDARALTTTLRDQVLTMARGIQGSHADCTRRRSTSWVWPERQAPSVRSWPLSIAWTSATAMTACRAISHAKSLSICTGCCRKRWQMP